MIFLIGLMIFFIDIQASQLPLKKQDQNIFQYQLDATESLMYHVKQLYSSCYFLTCYELKELEENRAARFEFLGIAKCIQEMRANAECINNQKWAIRNFLEIPNHHIENIVTSKEKMAGVLLEKIPESFSADITSEDMLQYDWAKITSEQTIYCGILLNKRKKILENINRLYHENQQFNSYQVQKNLNDYKLNCLAIYANKYNNVREFFNWADKNLNYIKSIANLDETVEKIFTSKDI